MNDSIDDRKYFTQTVTEMGETHDVVTSRAIFNSIGVKIVDKGVAINRSLYERLTRHKLQTPLEQSASSANCVTGESLRHAAALIMDDVPFFGRLAPDPASRKLLLNVIKTVPLPDAMAFQITVARDARPEIYMNLLRTALVAAWLASKSNRVSRFDLDMAASAGLLHDIGMLHIDPLLLQGSNQLNREQRRQLYSHPLLSNILVERHHQYPREVVRAVSEHQEHLDGSGYPRNLSGDGISPLGRTVTLAQVVAAMFAPGRNAPEMQLSVLLRMNAQRYDPMMTTQILTLVQPQLDVMSAAVELMDDPVALLGQIDVILAQLPLVLEQDAAFTPARRGGMALVADHGARLCRALADVGAVPDQLVQLGPAAKDESVRIELTLLAREASWQLRTLGREARRRWRIGVDEQYPPVLHGWLDQIDALTNKLAESRPAAAAEDTSAVMAAQAAATAVIAN